MYIVANGWKVETMKSYNQRTQYAKLYLAVSLSLRKELNYVHSIREQKCLTGIGDMQNE